MREVLEAGSGEGAGRPAGARDAAPRRPGRGRR
jgi:hypothetical protein